MYGTFIYIWVVLGVNEGKYTIEHLGKTAVPFPRFLWRTKVFYSGSHSTNIGKKPVVTTGKWFPTQALADLKPKHVSSWCLMSRFRSVRVHQTCPYFLQDSLQPTREPFCFFSQTSWVKIRCLLKVGRWPLLFTETFPVVGRSFFFVPQKMGG